MVDRADAGGRARRRLRPEVRRRRHRRRAGRRHHRAVAAHAVADERRAGHEHRGRNQPPRQHRTRPDHGARDDDPWREHHTRGHDDRRCARRPVRRRRRRYGRRQRQRDRHRHPRPGHRRLADPADQLRRRQGHLLEVPRRQCPGRAVRPQGAGRVPRRHVQPADRGAGVPRDGRGRGGVRARRRRRRRSDHGVCAVRRRQRDPVPLGRGQRDGAHRPVDVLRHDADLRATGPVAHATTSGARYHRCGARRDRHAVVRRRDGGHRTGRRRVGRQHRLHDPDQQVGGRARATLRRPVAQGQRGRGRDPAVVARGLHRSGEPGRRTRASPRSGSGRASPAGSTQSSTSAARRSRPACSSRRPRTST